MPCPSEVLRSTLPSLSLLPSAALANVVHEPSQFHKHKDFNLHTAFIKFWEAMGVGLFTACQ